MENTFKKIVEQSQKLAKALDEINRSTNEKQIKSLGLLTWSNNLAAMNLKKDTSTETERKKIHESLNNLLFIAMNIADDLDIPLVSGYITYLNDTIAYVNRAFDERKKEKPKGGNEMERVKTLIERSSEAPFLIQELRELYGGDLVLPSSWVDDVDRPYIVGNFVQGVFGGVSYSDIRGKEGGYPISGGDSFDRLTMGLLRLTDAVMVGASTLRTEPDHLWTPEFITPEHAELWKKQRQHMRKHTDWQPFQCFVTASGNINFNAKVFSEPEVRVLIFTTDESAHTLVDTYRERLTATNVDVAVCESTADGNVNLRDMLKQLRRRWGVKTLLVEGGAVFYNNLEREELVDEIFVTVAPRNVGGSKTHPRPVLSMATGAGYTPEKSPVLELVSLKVRDSFLYQRWKYRR